MPWLPRAACTWETADAESKPLHHYSCAFPMLQDRRSSTLSQYRTGFDLRKAAVIVSRTVLRMLHLNSDTCIPPAVHGGCAGLSVCCE